MKWDDGWIYSDDRLPPSPKRSSHPRIITFENRYGERRSTIGIYMGDGQWKMHNGIASYRVVAWQEMPTPALGKLPQFLQVERSTDGQSDE